jgi:very-short-patch-repair endonuclease
MAEAFNQKRTKTRRQHLRATMPDAEVMLWSKLKGRQLLGCKFRRQFGIGSYTVDFFSPDIELAIELDGEIHYRPGRQERDSIRDAAIRAFGIRILRFSNTDVYENLEGVWEAIARAAREQIQRIRPDDAPGRKARRTRKASRPSDATPPFPPLRRGGINDVPYFPKD